MVQETFLSRQRAEDSETLNMTNNAAQESTERIVELGKVFLMDRESRYIPFNIEIRGEEIRILDQKQKLHQLQRINKTHVHTADSQGEKHVDKLGKFHSAILSFTDHTFLRVYFFTLEQMQQAVQGVVEC